MTAPRRAEGAPRVASVVSHNRLGLPAHGLGLGMRGPHLGDLLRSREAIGCLELITENVLYHRGRLRPALHELRARMPMVLHGVSLSIAGSDPLDLDYIDAVGALADELEVSWLSDHLCFTGVDAETLHELLPCAYDDATLRHVAARVDAVQTRLRRPLVLENVSSYIGHRADVMSQMQFLAALVATTGCGLLLDVNNLVVCAYNHDGDVGTALDALPYDAVVQLHVAGHSDRGTHLVDSHIGPVPDAVWRLAEDVLARTGPCTTVLEWDDDLPDLATTWAEARRGLPWLDAGVARATARAQTPVDRGSPLSRAPQRPTALATRSSPSPAATCAEDDGVAAGQRALVVAIVSGWATSPKIIPTEQRDAGQGDAAQGDAGQRDAGQGDASAASRWTASRALSAAARLGVVRGLIEARLVDAITATYPALTAAMGPEAIAPLVRGAIADGLGGSWAIEATLATVPEWLRRQRLGPRWWRDVARFEAAVAAAAPWPDPTPLDVTELAAVAPEARANVRLRWHASVALHLLPRVAADALRRGLPTLADDVADAPREGALALLVHRRGGGVVVRRCERAEAAILAPLLAGEALGDALEQVLGDEPVLEEAILSGLGAFTARWARDGAVVGLLS